MLITDLPWAWIHWHINPTSTSSKGLPCLQLLEFSCDSSCSFAIGQFRWTSSRTHLLDKNVWQKPKYKFCVIMLITHVSTLLRWDVKWLTFVSAHCWTNNVRQFDAKPNSFRHFLINRDFFKVQVSHFLKTHFLKCGIPLFKQLKIARDQLITAKHKGKRN